MSAHLSFGFDNSTILYFIIDKITGGEFFKEVAILHPDTHPRIVRADRTASTVPRAHRRGQRSPTERSLLVNLYDQHDSGMSRCYNTWPGSRCSQRTSLATLHTITEMDEEMEAFVSGTSEGWSLQYLNADLPSRQLV
jgi:hypothetical protein